MSLSLIAVPLLSSVTSSQPTTMLMFPTQDKRPDHTHTEYVVLRRLIMRTMFSSLLLIQWNECTVSPLLSTDNVGQGVGMTRAR